MCNVDASQLDVMEVLVEIGNSMNESRDVLYRQWRDTREQR